ncbi:MAG: hypothetical protein ACI91B_004408, partial [Planctomycetota bacterium]
DTATGPKEDRECRKRNDGEEEALIAKHGTIEREEA